MLWSLVLEASRVAKQISGLNSFTFRSEQCLSELYYIFAPHLQAVDVPIETQQRQEKFLQLQLGRELTR